MEAEPEVLAASVESTSEKKVWPELALGGGEGEPAVSPQRPWAPLTCILHPSGGPCSHCWVSCHHTCSGCLLSARPFPTLPDPKGQGVKKASPD